MSMMLCKGLEKLKTTCSLTGRLFWCLGFVPPGYLRGEFLSNPDQVTVLRQPVVTSQYNEIIKQGREGQLGECQSSLYSVTDLDLLKSTTLFHRGWWSIRESSAFKCPSPPGWTHSSVSATELPSWFWLYSHCYRTNLSNRAVLCNPLLPSMGSCGTTISESQ